MSGEDAGYDMQNYADVLPEPRDAPIAGALRKRLLNQGFQAADNLRLPQNSHCLVALYAGLEKK
jgi:hypothetical protein